MGENFLREIEREREMLYETREREREMLYETEYIQYKYRKCRAVCSGDARGKKDTVIQ